MAYEVESNGSGVYVYRVTREEVARFQTIDDAQVFMSAVSKPAAVKAEPVVTNDPIAAAVAAVDQGLMTAREAAAKYGIPDARSISGRITIRNNARNRWANHRIAAE